MVRAFLCLQSILVKKTIICIHTLYLDVSQQESEYDEWVELRRIEVLGA